MLHGDSMIAPVVAKALSGFGLALIKPITDLVSEFIVDKDKANELAHKLATLADQQAHEVTLAQIGVNKQEAAHKSLFVAGWRPFIGWVCGSAMGFNYLAVPIANAFDAGLVPLDATLMYPVLLGMLGMGGMRTAEKVQGVSRER